MNEKIRQSLKREVHKKKVTNAIVGKKTKLPLGQWLQEVFRLNEALPSQEKLTDPMLVSSMIGEFSRRLSMVRKLEASPSLFSSERSRHNRKSKDFLVSFRYSEAGFPITGKGKNCKALTISDCRKRAFNLKKLDPRLFTAEEIEYARSLADEEYSEFFIPSQEEMGEFKFGSILFGVREKSIISIELLEMTWLQER